MAPLIKDCGWLPFEMASFQGACQNGTRDPHADHVWSERNRVIWFDNPASFYAQLRQSILEENDTPFNQLHQLSSPEKWTFKTFQSLLFFSIEQKKNLTEKSQFREHPSCLKGIPSFLLSAIKMNSYKGNKDLKLRPRENHC